MIDTPTGHRRVQVVFWLAHENVLCGGAARVVARYQIQLRYYSGESVRECGLLFGLFSTRLTLIQRAPFNSAPLSCAAAAAVVV